MVSFIKLSGLGFLLSAGLIALGTDIIPRRCNVPGTSLLAAQPTPVRSFPPPPVSPFVVRPGLDPAFPLEPALPPNIERFDVKTTYADVPTVPFYIRCPANYVPETDPSKRKLHRLLLICPYLNHSALANLKGEEGTGPLLKMADERGWFVLVPYFSQKYKTAADAHDRNRFYYYPETFSGKTVVAAIKETTKRYPVDTWRLFVHGMSGGAQFVHRFTIWAPEHVAAVSINSASWIDPPQKRSARVAWLVVYGELDPCAKSHQEFLDELQKLGAITVRRSYSDDGHGGCHNQLTAAFFAFYDGLTKDELGRCPNPNAEEPVGSARMPPKKMPFVGDTLNWQYYPNTSEVRNNIPATNRVFLPTEDIAKAWGKKGDL